MEETKEERIEYKIYKITCNETGEVYFGKTTKTLEQRLWQHKDLSCISRQIILRNKYRIEQINSTFDEEESVRLERLYIENNECINIQIPGRTKKEWCETNKEELSEYYKEWYELNKEKHSKNMKEYHKKNREKMLKNMKEYREKKYTCECGSTLRIVGKTLHERTQKHINYMNSKK